MKFPQTMTHLEELLHTMFVLQAKTQMYHRNYTGSNFLEVHKFFQDQYTFFFNECDEVAERIKTIGGCAHLQLHDLSKHTKLSLSTSSIQGDSMMGEYQNDLEYLISQLYEIIPKIAKGGDIVTEDYLVGLLGTIEKNLWILESFKQSK